MIHHWCSPYPFRYCLAVWFAVMIVIIATRILPLRSRHRELGPSGLLTDRDGRGLTHKDHSSAHGANREYQGPLFRHLLREMHER